VEVCEVVLGGATTDTAGALVETAVLVPEPLPTPPPLPLLVEAPLRAPRFVLALGPLPVLPVLLVPALGLD
jgi:hypothetical protein